MSTTREYDPARRAMSTLEIRRNLQWAKLAYRGRHVPRRECCWGSWAVLGIALGLGLGVFVVLNLK